MSMARSYDEEFTAFAAAALPHLRRTAYLMSGDWHRAEDVAQDALIKVYGAWRRVEQRDGLLPYARRTTIRLLIDESRRPWRRERPTAAHVAESLVRGDGSARFDDRDEMVRALSELPAGRRACVVLRYYHDLSVAETAEALGCSEGTVKSQTSHALQSLRALLGDEALVKGPLR
jgi:RNA polymerase sigma-70 factor (sigma-E family)